MSGCLRRRHFAAPHGLGSYSQYLRGMNGARTGEVVRRTYQFKGLDEGAEGLEPR